MRGRDDRAAANQRANDALYQAKLKAVNDCDRDVVPEACSWDQTHPHQEELAALEAWDRLNVEYLKNDWPPSMLS